jgi:hypothetical protein
MSVTTQPSQFASVLKGTRLHFAGADEKGKAWTVIA